MALAGELQLWIARSMGVDATVQDWIAFEEKCSTWSVPFVALFMEWLKSLESGSTFCRFEGTEQEVRFVGSHVQGKQQWKQVR
jgi:hypothetical protein